jgi:hypothetical protein
MGVQISCHELATSKREWQRRYYQRHNAWVQEPAAWHARQYRYQLSAARRLAYRQEMNCKAGWTCSERHQWQPFMEMVINILITQ